MTVLKRAGVFLAILSFLAVGGTGGASAQDIVFVPHLSAPYANDELNVEYAVPAQYVAAAQSFTNPASRATAQPLAWNSETAPAVVGETVTIGVPRWANGGMPDVEADAAAKSMYAEAWTAIEAAAGTEFATAFEPSESEYVAPDDNFSADNPSVHTSIRGNAYGKMWDPYPYRTVGKIYVYEDEGGSLVYAGYCSGSVMGEENIIVTAAHCLYDQDDLADPWYDAWEFVPADRNGQAPYGSWSATNALVRVPWTTGGGRNYDVGLLKLQYKFIDDAWRPVSYYTGWLGRVLNYDYAQHLFAIGYPSNLEGGIFSYICASESFWVGATDYMSMGCNMTFGSSGGPWIWKFHPYRGGSYNYVMSVVSGGVAGSNVFTGPRFSDENIGSLCATWDCGGTEPQP